MAFDSRRLTMGEANLQLRRAGATDAAAIRELVNRAYEKWVPLVGRKPRPMLADYDNAVIAHHIDVIELDGHLAGLIEMMPEERDLFVVNLAVDPQFQGRGVGKALMLHADDVAREMGFSSLRLMTLSVMQSNITLYQRFGYVTFDREEVEGHGEALNMRRVLG